MAIVEFLGGKAYSKQGTYRGYKTHGSMKRVIDYITRLDKTSEHLIKGVNCSPQNAYEEFMLNKSLWNKEQEGHRMIIHFTQSFDRADNVTPEMASEIAEKLLKHEKFEGFQVLYATHTDTKHLHTHFVIDTVNKETGRMWQLSEKEMQEIKDYSDQLCREYQLSVCQKRENYTTPHTRKNEIEVLKQGESWKEEIRIAAQICAKEAVSKADFIYKMKELGYGVTWTDERKYITFRDSMGHRVRHHRLEPVEAFTKEALLKQFELNKQVREMAKAKALEERAKALEAKAQRATEKIDGMNAYQGIRSFLYIAKNLVQAAEQPYPLQNHDAFHRMGTKSATEEFVAEQKKGRGYEAEHER